MKKFFAVSALIVVVVVQFVAVPQAEARDGCLYQIFHYRCDVHGEEIMLILEEGSPVGWFDSNLNECEHPNYYNERGHFFRYYMFENYLDNNGEWQLINRDYV